jgi:small-conductance mechanosensitive channel
MIITFDNWWTVLPELNVSIDNAFKEAGVTIAFPQRDARSDATGPLEVRVVSEPFGSEAQIRSSEPPKKNRAVNRSGWSLI